MDTNIEYKTRIRYLRVDFHAKYNAKNSESIQRFILSHYIFIYTHGSNRRYDVFLANRMHVFRRTRIAFRALISRKHNIYVNYECIYVTNFIYFVRTPWS